MDVGKGRTSLLPETIKLEQPLWNSVYTRINLKIQLSPGNIEPKLYIWLQRHLPIHVHAHWHNRGTNILGAVNHFLIRSKAHSMRWNPCPTLLE